MKILYVTDAWTALSPLLYEGAEEMRGMPGFQKPLKTLLKQGHEIHMILYDNVYENQGKPYCVRSQWLTQIRILNHFYLKYHSGLRKLISQTVAFCQIRAAVKKALDTEKYDFVYGQGPLSEAANAVCRKHQIPFGQRRYGDSLLSLIEQKGCLYALLSRPIDLISYQTKKAFLLGTNDGSKIDELYRKLNRGKTPTPFYFWTNGVDAVIPNSTTISLPETPFLLYTARIAEWKRQDRAIELLHCLKERGYCLNLLFAGPADSADYQAELLRQISQYGLEKQARFLGAQSAEILYALAQHALACLSFYDISNFGNCVIEYLKAGGLVCALNDGTLDEVICNGETGFLVDTMEEGADIIARLLEEPLYREDCRQKSKANADRQFCSWEERINREIALIHSNSCQKEI